MQIVVTYGKGSGISKLAAFDAALFNAGVANYNLLTLSSVIPPDSKVLVEKIDRNKKEIGNKLYVVLSKDFGTRPGKTVCAGLGWVVREEDGSGVFMEESGGDRKAVEKIIKKDLKAAVSYREGIFTSLNCKVEEVECTNKVVCVVVVAVYESEGWK